MPSKSTSTAKLLCPECGRFLVEFRKDTAVYLKLPCRKCKGTVVLNEGKVRFHERKYGVDSLSELRQ